MATAEGRLIFGTRGNDVITAAAKDRVPDHHALEHL
ncbi:hypothetical protein PM3016_4734 [Paenibacillus mucilaginosus 3016]|uniref:Uncharacterized protein n=1 Tax=Paenibacillus mucilaginosus 3016 TaxID=1116391 RepID=H6NI73_9BACL|nr:hypothetical protein PM3016_4734 [Paenibacillus mucilaginosus 3016]